MRKQLKKIKTCTIFLSVALLCACSSVGESEVSVLPDYSEDDVRKNEISRIDELLEKDTVQSLWRAYLLGDEQTIAKTSDAVLAEYKKALEDKDYFNARRLYLSLSACGYQQLSALEKNEKELTALINQEVSALSSEKASQPKISATIKGTVTVWVDKGVKVENGMGYADRTLGSGFFISKNGYIVTNHHVISDLVDPKHEGYARLYIKLAEDSTTRIPAKVIGYDSVIDLALLKAEIDAPYVFTLGSSADLDVGDRIYAIGSPVGLEKTLTSGIVSATDRKLFTTGSVYQIDAAINSGNSGGPCVDENGRVQAIAFAGMLQFEGLNFAIPVEYLKAVLPALYHGGKVMHPWLGAYGHTKKELGKNSGVEVQYTMPSGSAWRSKLPVGSVITSVAGTPVSSLEEAQNVLLTIPAKTIVSISYVSGTDLEEKKSCVVYLAERPEYPGYEVYKNDVIADSFVPIFGMKLLKVSTSSAKKYQIQSVIRGSIADESGFSENDPIEVLGVEFNAEKSAMLATISAKKRKKGYIDISMAIQSAMDSPYYF